MAKHLSWGVCVCIYVCMCTGICISMGMVVYMESPDVHTGAGLSAKSSPRQCMVTDNTPLPLSKTGWAFFLVLFPVPLITYSRVIIVHILGC